MFDLKLDENVDDKVKLYGFYMQSLSLVFTRVCYNTTLFPDLIVEK